MRQSAMDVDRPEAPAPKAPTSKSCKHQDLVTSTLKTPPFAYAHLGLATPSPTAATLDALQVRAYCAAALRRFLGDTGAGVPVDVLATRGAEVWVRVPRQDLAALAAALTAYPGSNDGGGEAGVMLLRLRACGDWLGSLIGRAEESHIWGHGP